MLHIFLMKRKKSNNFLKKTENLNSYESGRNSEFITPMKTKIHGEQNPLLARIISEDLLLAQIIPEEETLS